MWSSHSLCLVFCCGRIIRAALGTASTSILSSQKGFPLENYAAEPIKRSLCSSVSKHSGVYTTRTKSLYSQNMDFLFACVFVAMRFLICIQFIFLQFQNYGFIALPVIAKIKLILIFIHKTKDHTSRCCDYVLIYRTLAIITRGLHIFYPIFQCKRG